MRTRIIITATNGMPITALDSAHADGHAQRFVEENIAALATQGIAAIAVEFDPVTSGADALEDLRNLTDVRLEIRATPGAGREVIGIHRHGGAQRLSARAVARAFRVLHAPADIRNARGTPRSNPGSAPK